jgi:hypothetical protein
MQTDQKKQVTVLTFRVEQKQMKMHVLSGVILMMHALLKSNIDDLITGVTEHPKYDSSYHEVI